MVLPVERTEMTKNKAQKNAVRARMNITGETYLQASQAMHPVAMYDLTKYMPFQAAVEITNLAKMGVPILVTGNLSSGKEGFLDALTYAVNNPEETVLFYRTSVKPVHIRLAKSKSIESDGTVAQYENNKKYPLVVAHDLPVQHLNSFFNASASPQIASTYSSPTLNKFMNEIPHLIVVNVERYQNKSTVLSISEISNNQQEQSVRKIWVTKEKELTQLNGYYPSLYENRKIISKIPDVLSTFRAEEPTVVELGEESDSWLILGETNPEEAEQLVKNYMITNWGIDEDYVQELIELLPGLSVSLRADWFWRPYHNNQNWDGEYPEDDLVLRTLTDNIDEYKGQPTFTGIILM